MTLRLYAALNYSQNSAHDFRRAAKWIVSAFFAKGYVHITNSKQRKHRSVAGLAQNLPFQFVSDMLLPLSGAGAIPCSARTLLMVLRASSCPSVPVQLEE